MATVGALNGGADAYADDNAPAFRDAVAAALERPARLDLDTLRAEQARLKRFSDSPDARDIWRALGFADLDAIPSLPAEAFQEQADALRQNADDAR
ncbi:hypothetical protein [Caballeronia sp. LjRoot31]|uniref:hypothetical protein n=1 Tax=Caballeronia sp. LjRoot31 TaxID=3342324 RepID=UPI003ECE9CB4